jgi:hypothetical protein
LVVNNYTAYISTFKTAGYEAALEFRNENTKSSAQKKPEAKATGLSLKTVNVF